MKNLETIHGNDSRKRLGVIPITFKDKFPKGYRNNVAHWGNFSKEELHQETDEGVQRLLHLDIDFGNSCSLKCPHCFRRDDRFDDAGDKGFLTENELLEYILEAKKLGLQSVKFLGRGEPFENPRFLGFLNKLYEMDIKSAIFTKGHVIGSDDLARKYNSHYGITDGKDLAQRLKELDASILLGFNSFDRRVQENFIGIDNSAIKNYVELRDNALLRLVEAGLNEYKEGEETRLAIISAPIKPENVDEIFDIYKWGRIRNIYALSCPTTVSGKGIDEAERTRQYKDYLSNLKDLYTKIYLWNLEHGLTSLEQFKEEGVSLYPGCHPCNQTAAGMYLTLSGKVVRCPGRADKQSTFIDDIRKENLKTVWMNSENYKRAQGKGFNYHCPARDGHSLSNSFYKEIKEKVIEEFK